MAIKIEKLEREFHYNGLVLADVPGQSPEDVRSIYSAAYPEITAAVIEGPERKGEKLVYTFKRAVGTKGATLDVRFQHIDGLDYVNVVPEGTPGSFLVRLKKALGPRIERLGQLIDKYLFAC